MPMQSFSGAFMGKIKKPTRIGAFLLLSIGAFIAPVQAAEEEKETPQPIHFVRDVMQPMGMPVVTSFHNLRENQFLNMHRKKSDGLEAIGDFFLAPSRYLFAGKTVQILD